MSEVINLNRTTPAAEAGYVLGRWQRVTTPSSTDPTSGQPVFATSVELANVGGATPKTANYTAVAADCGTLLTFNSGSALTLTLPATPPPIGTAPTNLWKVAVSNIGAGLLTINPNGLNIDGSASNLTLNQGFGFDIYTDGTNYFTVRGAVTPQVNDRWSSVVLAVSGISVISTGDVGAYFQVPYAGTIVGWSVTSKNTGSITVDVWKEAGTPPPTATAPPIPTSANKISASTPVTVTTASAASGGATAISTWSTLTVAAGDVFGFSVASVSVFTAFTLQIYIQRT